MTVVPREGCHDGPCDGHEEVARLMRGMGPLFEGRKDGVVGGLVNAFGQWKSKINGAMCQEWREGDPCLAHRLLPVHARRWAFPACADLTSENLCKWIDLVRSCPPGSRGFIAAAIEFVLPGKNITLDWQVIDGKAYWQASDRRACENCLIVNAPPDCFAFVEECRDLLGHVQDGANPERRYFIPEIECLRRAAFPIGLSVGYRTDPQGPNGEEIYGVTGEAACDPPAIPLICCD